jgi:DNA-binding CsgD family transcriptional regulator
MRGLRRSEIAQEMGIEPGSVSTYTKRIYDKFAIHRRQDLFRLAERLEREWGERN